MVRRRGREIEEQSIVDRSGCFQITANNREVNVFQRADRFQFDDNLVFDEEIESMFADLMLAIEKWHWLLSLELRFRWIANSTASASS